MSYYQKIQQILGDKSSYYLDHTCEKIRRNRLSLPSFDSVENFQDSDRNVQVLKSLSQL